MKKNIFSLGVLAAAAIALVGCAKTETNVPEVKGTGIPFEFTATSAVTKTTNDTEATKWVAGDQVNLFHAELGGTTEALTYVDDKAFTAATDGAEVKFTGTLADGFDPEGTYNWYAFYPYSKYITTPANSSAGYVTVGSLYNQTQTQKGNGSMAHIAGSNYPIAGIAKKISGSEKLTIEMRHLTSLIEVGVKNGTSNPITVTNIAFTGTKDLVGQYYIDFSESTAVYNPRGASYVSNTAKLTVEEGTPIAAGGTAYFYLAVKPFTASAGEKLTLSVTTAEHGAQEVEKTLTGNTTFEAGVENFLNFTYKQAETEEYVLVTNPDDLTVGSEVIIAAANYDSAMGAQNSTYKSSVEITRSDNTIIGPSSSISRFILGQGDGNYYSFEENDTFLSATGGGNNLGNISDIDASSSWKVSLGEGMAQIRSSREDITQVVMSYNSNDPRFTCYASVLSNDSVTGDVAIYKKEGTGDDTKVISYIDIPASLAVVSGSTTDLGAVTNSSATITYSSSDPGVATVSSAGVVTAVGAGTCNITASIAASGNYLSAQQVCEVTVSAAETWVLTSIGDIAEDDVFVIVGKTKEGTTYYAMPNNATSAAPSAEAITISGDRISSVVDDAWKWNLGSATNGYIFYPYGTTTSWLYMLPGKNNSGTNNGVRVGTATSNNTFTITSDGYLHQSGLDRSLCIYNNQDWRCYATSGTTYSTTVATISFYVKQ